MSIRVEGIAFQLPATVVLALLLSCGNRVEMNTEQGQSRRNEARPVVNPVRSCPIHGAVRAPACVYSFKEAAQSERLTTAVMVGGWLGEQDGKKLLFESKSDMELSRASSIELVGLERTSYEEHPSLFHGRLVRIVGFMRAREECGEGRPCQRVLDVKAINYVVGEDARAIKGDGGN
mgnify:CR=1 FL=1